MICGIVSEYEQIEQEIRAIADTLRYAAHREVEDREQALKIAEVGLRPLAAKCYEQRVIGRPMNKAKWHARRKVNIEEMQGEFNLQPN